MVSVVQRDESSEVRSAALSALKALAPVVKLDAAIALLASRLAEPASEAAAVCEVLGSMRPAPTKAIPLLRTALERDDLVLPAAAALWRIEGRPEAILPALKRAFDDNGEGVCDLLCELGSAALPLVPDLLRALSEDNWDLQWAAADALCAIASSDPVVLAPLLDALAHPSPIVRSASARALAAAGVGAVDALRALVADATDPRAAWAAYALGEMGPVAAAALPELRLGMGEEEAPLAACCAIAVALIATDVDAVPFLVTALQSEDPRTPRRAVAAALAQFGPAAADAVSALETLLDDQDPELAEAALEALSAIQGLSH
jgi:HEAT repeat protein